ncbi:hypothetical protein IFM89_035816 [Coptis chinensis]|uniref:Uncharacterized protein n=1 Tax=Coptis chinensis TaxID=261450 RepID=A0A835M5V5_9MAGN|nr:hypothetical protein IFM89_035816 [Coptis chinensis]
MVLPFTPHSITFEDIKYFVDMPIGTQSGLGRNVVCTIHHPSIDILRRLMRVLMESQRSEMDTIRNMDVGGDKPHRTGGGDYPMQEETIGAKILVSGLHPSEIISGYTKAIAKAIELLDELVEEGSEIMDVRNKDEVVLRMKVVVASKQYGQEDILSPLIADVSMVIIC